MQLNQLLDIRAPGATTEITGLTADSRAVEPGFLFAALPGTRHDGRQFIDQAIAAGAVAVLAPRGTRLLNPAITLIEDSNPRRRFAHLAARFFDRQPQAMAAVTGTNGKTSVVSFTRQLWQLLGIRAGSVGTLGIQADGYQQPGGLTTPDPVALHAGLAGLADAGVDHVAFEASSHGLAQYRLDGVDFKVAAFTNLSRDHLDYHGTFEAYFYAKARLFGELLPPSGSAVINVDGRYGREVENLAWARGISILSVGRESDAHLRLLEATPVAEGQALDILHEADRYQVVLPLVGGFQAENALLAAGIVMAFGVAASDVLPLLAHLQGVPGRLQFAGSSASGAAAYVDYAHTPDGLENVLKAARAHTDGRLHVIFGCGGDRDTGKRPLMGRIAAELADRVIVTDDNPRTENAASIRAEILASCPDAEEIGDRRAAIEAAVTSLQTGDLLVVAGKGHEEGQIVGNQVLPFSDLATLAEALGRTRGEVGA